jgi:hypothetical protein
MELSEPVQEAMYRLIDLLLERFGGGGDEPRERR